VVYASARQKRDKDGVTSVVDRRLTIVSLDDLKLKRLLGGKYVVCPSWCWRSGQIAYSVSAKYNVKLASGKKSSGSRQTIWTCDSDGRNRTVVSQVDVEDLSRRAEEFLKDKPRVEKEAREEFKALFGRDLTPYDLKRLDKGSMSVDEMFDKAALIAAHRIGGFFEDEVKQVVKKPGWTIKDLEEPIGRLPEPQRQRFLETMMGGLATAGPWFDEIMMAALNVTTGSDTRPVWSPDGLRMAFERLRGFTPESSTLEVLDLRSLQQNTLFTTTGDISAITWAGSDSLVFHSTQIVKESPRNFTSTSPEIWHLELK